jgi:hypothetical protein
MMMEPAEMVNVAWTFTLTFVVHGDGQIVVGPVAKIIG